MISTHSWLDGFGEKIKGLIFPVHAKIITMVKPGKTVFKSSVENLLIAFTIN